MISSYGMENRKQRQADGSQTDGDDDQTFDSDPMESIADPRADVMKTLFPDDTPGNPLVTQAENFIETQLKPAQQDMIYGHLGEGKYLEDLRREENKRTGKEVKMAAYHDRWDRIIQKGCRYLRAAGTSESRNRNSRKSGNEKHVLFRLVVGEGIVPPRILRQGGIAMQIKHRVRINVADRNGNQQNVLESRKLRVPQRILRLLFGDFCEVLVLTPGKQLAPRWIGSRFVDTAMKTKNTEAPPQKGQKYGIQICNDSRREGIEERCRSSHKSVQVFPNGLTNGWTYSDYTGLMTVVNNTNTPSGTNWEDALMYAKDVADAKKLAQPDEPVFVIFLTDGEPTAVYNEHGGAHHYIGDYGDVHGNGFIAAYKPSRDDAKAIVDEGYGFYGIFTFNPGEEQTRYLKRLVHYAYTGYDVSDTTEGDFSYLDSSQYVGSNFFNADSPENLASAFDDIFATITTMIAHGNISIVDGLTTDAMTSTLVAGKADGFTYKVADEHGNTLYTVKATGNTSNPSVTFKIGNTTYSGDQVEVKTAGNGKKYYSVTANGKEYKMAFADFVNTGEGDDEIKELTWDLSAIGTLENQYTYSLETVVWPNQEAYDYVAALNNGLMEWNEATQIPVYEDETETKVKYYKNGVKDYPSIVWDPNKRVYSVLTNTKQELEYSIISTTNGVETIEGPYTVDLDTPDPMDLKATASALEKVWNINRDPSILYKYLYESKDDQGNPKAFNIGFDINQDGELYKEIDLPGKATVTAEGVTYDWSAYKTDDLVEHNGKTFSKRWSQDFSISTGLMLSEAQMDARSLDKSLYNDKKYYFNNTWYYVLEPGHDFKISEPAVGYEFDFEGPTYHPMLVDGVLTDVKFTTEGSTKRISGMEALEIDTPTGKSALTVFNTLRGYVNIKKKVVDSDGTTALTTDNTEFTFDVELTNAMPVFEGDHIPWYGVNGLYYHNVDADDEYYQAEYKNGKLQVTTEEGGPYEGVGTTFNPDYADEQTITYLVDGKEVSVTICGNQMTPYDGNDTDGYKKVTGTARITQTETLYIANVPVNTHYTITETGLAALGYQLIDIERKVGTNPSAPVAGEIENGIGGEIVQNTETLITYTNKCLVTDVSIQKVDEDGSGIEGAVFQLKTVSNNGHSEELATTIESIRGVGNVTKVVNGETTTYASAFESTGGVQTFSGLPDGTYRLYEVYIPAGYISTFRYIQFTIDNRKMKNVTTDNGDVSMLDTTANNVDLKITNISGAELPHTGGPGTRLFTILGSIMIAGAGLMLWRKRRFV